MSGEKSHPTSIGMLARHELLRLVETRPAIACLIVSKAEESFQRKVHHVYNYTRGADGDIDSKKQIGTSYIFTNNEDCLILMIAPSGPVRISDEEIWIEDTLPSATYAAIEAEATGKMPSHYVSLEGFDVDSLAPKGIEGVEKTDIFSEDFLFLKYPIIKLPFAQFAAELRARAIRVISDEVHSTTRSPT